SVPCIDWSRPEFYSLSLHDALPIFRDQLAPLVVIGIGQQRLDRDIGELGIAIERLAIGISELGGFDLQMDEVGACGVEPVELKRSEEHTSELQSRENLVCRLLLEKK